MGVKPAKDFMFHERGANNLVTVSTRFFWVAVTKLISKGFTSDAAID